jgi:hypothetical protein
VEVFFDGQFEVGGHLGVEVLIELSAAEEGSDALRDWWRRSTVGPFQSPAMGRLSESNHCGSRKNLRRMSPDTTWCGSGNRDCLESERISGWGNVRSELHGGPRRFSSAAATQPVEINSAGPPLEGESYEQTKPKQGLG